MTKEEFIAKVEELDKKQGNYELTLWRNKEMPERRMNHIKDYPQNGIDFFEWALNQGEKVYVYEDVFKKKQKKHLTMYFVFPEYNTTVRFLSENGFENGESFKAFLRGYKQCGYIILIKKDDSVKKIVAKFERVKGYYELDHRRGFSGSIIKPEKKKRPRIKVERVRYC